MNRQAEFKIVPLRAAPERRNTAVDWFSSKWRIPRSAYEESIGACVNGASKTPQWYIAVNAKGNIIGGLGLIDNDFHDRPDLTPNVCAVFVEKEFRGQGVAKALLNYVRRDAFSLDYERLYLITDHTAFYERCGWTFKCMAHDVSGGGEIRLYEAGTLPE